MSLADYKKRKQISVSEAPAYPERGERRVSPLDEVFHSDKPVSLPVLPGLEPYRHSDNPVLMTQLEKLEKLEKEHKENKMCVAVNIRKNMDYRVNDHQQNVID